MIERSCLTFKPHNHRDSFIWALYEQHGGKRPFAEFAKDILYEIALLKHTNKSPELVSLSINGEKALSEKTEKSKASNKTKTAKSPNKVLNEHSEEKAGGQEEDDKTLSSEDILSVGNFN